MGLAGPPVVNPKSAAEALARNVVNNPRFGAELFTDIENFLAGTGRAAGAAAATGGGSAGVVAAEDAGEIVADFLGWGLVAAILLFIVALRCCENMFVLFASWIPLAGPSAARTVRMFFRWLDDLENSAIRYLMDQLVNLVRDFGRLVMITLELNGIDLSRSYRTTTAGGKGYATEAEVQRLQQEINVTNAAIRVLQYQVTPAGLPLGTGGSSSLPGTVTPTAPTVYTVKVPQNLWDQIHHVEHQQWQEHRDMTDFNTRLEKIEHKVASLERSFENLSQNVHAVRAIAVGWQDVERELESLGTTVSHFIDTSTAELNSHQRSLVQLAPLGLLLQPGVRGLKTLRQLEDTPCMCPKLPNIPRLQPELLAMYEYLTYG